MSLPGEIYINLGGKLTLKFERNWSWALKIWGLHTLINWEFFGR